MDRKKVLNVVFSIAPKERIQSIVGYNISPGGYRQILALQKTGHDYRSFVADNYFVCLISDTMAWKTMKNFDPLVTEPILVGDILFGQNLREYRRHLFELAADKQTLDYLISMARIYLFNAECSLGKYDEENFVKSGLYFSVLYAALAKYYFIRPRAASIERLFQEKRWPIVTEAGELIFAPENKSQAVYGRFLGKAQDYVKDVSITISLPSPKLKSRAYEH